MWSKDLVELLIVKYREHEHLYNIRHPMYLNRIKRSKTLFEICAVLKQQNENITIEEVKKKIHTLRSQYMRELREFKNSKRSNVDLESVKLPKLWCFNQLQFLKPHCATRNSVPTCESSETGINSTEEVDVFEKEKNEPTAELHCNKKKKTKLEERVDNISTLLTARLMKRKKYDWLGKQVVFELDRIKDEDLQEETAWKIQNLLREAAIKYSYKINLDTTSPGTSSMFTPPSTLLQDTRGSYTSSPDILQKPLDDTVMEEYAESYASSPDIVQQSSDDIKYENL